MLLNGNIVAINMSIIIDQRKVANFVNEVFILYKTLIEIKDSLIVTTRKCAFADKNFGAN